MKAATTLLVICVAGLLSLGLVMLYSASMAEVGARYLVMQLIWGGLGLGCCITAASLDYRLLKKVAWGMLIIAVLLLALVLVEGKRINGARRWLVYGSVRFQPSELAKLALIIMVAWYGDHFQRQMATWKRGVVIPGAIIAAVLAFIFVEPDRGTTILMILVCGAMLLLAGVEWKYFIPPIFVAVAGLAISLLRDPMRLHRMTGWLHLEEHKEGVGYQAYHAMVALGTGGWLGLGLGSGEQKLGFVPENHTDFILSVIGEELGLIATLLVILAFVIFVICGLVIAKNARDTFGFLLASGITLLIGIQAFINIGVVTSALPNKGLPLPFISYGGSNLLIMLVSVGLLLSVARQGKSPQKSEINLEEPVPARA